jgi:hypothetical protein
MYLEILPIATTLYKTLYLALAPSPCKFTLSDTQALRLVHLIARHHFIRALGTYSILPFQTLAIPIVFEMFRSGPFTPRFSKSRSARYPSLIDPRLIELRQIQGTTVAAT